MVTVAEEREVAKIVRIGPLRIAIEFDGDPAYGRILGTAGLAVDGESLDAYLGPDHDSNLVVVIHRCRTADNVYDEDKFLVGWNDLADAMAAWRRTGDRDPGTRTIDWSVTTLGALADVLRNIDERGPRVFANPETWNRITRECRMPSMPAPRLEPLPDPSDDAEEEHVVPAERWPWHARNRFGANVAEPLDSGAERFGMADQDSVPASTGYRIAETYPEEETVPVASYGAYTSPDIGGDPSREAERRSKGFDHELSPDTVAVGDPREHMRRLLKKVADTTEAAVAPVGSDVTPGRAFIEALRHLRNNAGEIYRDTGMSLTGRERRLVASMVASAVKNRTPVEAPVPDGWEPVADALVEAGLQDRLPSLALFAERDMTPLDVPMVVEALERCACAEREVLDEVAPPGWEKAVEMMKRRNVENPWALAWYLEKRGVDPSDWIKSNRRRSRRRRRRD